MFLEVLQAVAGQLRPVIPELPAILIAVPTAAALTVKTLQLARQLVGNGGARDRGWQRAMLENVTAVLTELRDGQRTERQMLREHARAMEQLAASIASHGDHELEVWERVSGQLEALTQRRSDERS